MGEFKNAVNEFIRIFLRSNAAIISPTISNPTLTGTITTNGANISTGATGTQIATTAAQLLSFHGATAVDQAAFIADPAGGATQDAEARTAINAILDLLAEKGLMAAS